MVIPHFQLCLLSGFFPSMYSSAKWDGAIPERVQELTGKRTQALPEKGQGPF